MAGVSESKSTSVGRVPVIEIAGYVGASLGLAAAGVALGGSATEGVQLTFDLIFTAVLVLAGWLLEPAVDAFGRMRSVFWFLSVFLVADLAGTVFGDEVSNPKTIAVVVGLVTTAYCLPLWWLSRRSLQLIALVVSFYGLLVAVLFPDPSAAFLFGPPDISSVAVVTWLLGVGLVASGVFGVLVPRKTAIALGSIAAIGGPLLLLVNNNDVLGELLSLASGAALVIIGTWRDEPVATGFGIVGLLIASAVVVGNHVKEEVPAIVVLAIGLLLLGGAIVAARATPREPGPPAPPMPESSNW